MFKTQQYFFCIEKRVHKKETLHNFFEIYALIYSAEKESFKFKLKQTKNNAH